MQNELHIYAQQQEHGEAYIIGDRAALIALRDAVDQAIKDDSPVAFNSFTSDGEGYTTIVKQSTVEQINEYRLPYTNSFSSEYDKGRQPGTDKDILKCLVLQMCRMDLKWNTNNKERNFLSLVNKKILEWGDLERFINMWELAPEPKPSLQDFLGFDDEMFNGFLSIRMGK